MMLEILDVNIFKYRPRSIVDGVVKPAFSSRSGRHLQRTHPKRFFERTIPIRVKPKRREIRFFHHPICLAQSGE